MRADAACFCIADRVGVIRKLRWNISLKREGSDLVIDTTEQRHKSELAALRPHLQTPPLTASHLCRGSIEVLR